MLLAALRPESLGTAGIKGLVSVERWKELCGKAVALVGSQTAFRKEARILQRLVKQYGAEEVEHMLAGAQLLKWTSLRSLGSADGLGRRWALATFWQSENHQKPQLESLAAVLKRKGLIP